MSDSISLSFDFIDKYVRFTKPEYIQVYLYIKYILQKDGGVPSAQDISKALDMPAAKAEFVLEYWASRGELSFSENGYSLSESSAQSDSRREQRRQKTKRILSSKPSYSQAEIDAVAAANKGISGLFYQAESVLNKVLTPSDMEMLFSFNDWLGLPVEVILMLLSYAAKKGKTTKHYLETVAIDWADKGIDTFEAAENHISELESLDSAEHAIRSVLGIYDRALTQTEKKYIKIWAEQLQVPTDLVSLAYDKTVSSTGKLSWSYMNKLLQSWTEQGFTTVEQVKAADEEFYRKNGTSAPSKTKKNKFDNYEDGNRTDYAKLEQEIFDMILEDD